ncbi:hypothetical protein ACFWB1_36630 [Streptomyces goshikiensis]|uniref:hypothetical protein n=1 Tax=Streptomyces goshikiensis TaxID=1942 RepID=UPI0036C98E4A
MNPIKRGLAALVLSGGAALALTPVAAHAAGEPAVEGPPITARVGDIVDHPGSAIHDTKTAVGTASTAVGSAAQATGSSLTGAGPVLRSGLPHAPKAV